MAKLPRPGGVAVVRSVPAAVKVLPEGATLARIYFSDGPYAVHWNQFRHHGPTNARFDHHLPDRSGAAAVQHRSVLYCGGNAMTCLAEVFQQTRRVDRVRNAPWLAVFELKRPMQLLDLTGRYPTRIGASMAINSGSRVRAREWARRFYEAYEELDGILYASSMHANEPAVVLNDRAETNACLPPYPRFNRALADDALLDILKHTAAALGYGLR